MQKGTWEHNSSLQMSVHDSGLVLSYAPCSSEEYELRHQIRSGIPLSLLNSDIEIADLILSGKRGMFEYCQLTDTVSSNVQ